MAKELIAPHVEANSALPTTTEYLMHLRCNEGTAASNLVDDLGVRTMTQVGSPAVSPSAAQDDAVLGARSFDGATQYAGRATSADHTALQGEYGLAFWVKQTNSTNVIMEYGEFGATLATNVQVSIRLFANQIQFQWERGAGALSAQVLMTVPVGEWHHVGVCVSIDPSDPTLRCVEGYLDGEKVTRATGLLPPEGGTSSSWIVGASRHRGTAIGTPGAFLAGELDDVIVTKFPPDSMWFRAQAARGLRDWRQRTATTLVPGEQWSWSTHVRVLVHVGNEDVTAFSWLGKVDIEWIDLSSIIAGGHPDRLDFMVGEVRWSDSVDDLVGTAEFEVARAFGFFSMSPFVVGDVYGNNPLSTAAGVPLLRAMREVRIETCLAPAHMTKDLIPSWAWEVQFDGFIRSVNVSESSVKVSCADLGIAALDVFIEPNKLGGDRTYGTAASTAIEGELSKIVSDNDPAFYDVISIPATGIGVQIVCTVFANNNADPANVNGRGRPPTCAIGDKVILTGTVNYNTAAGSTDVVSAVSATTITLTRTSAASFGAESVGLLQGPRRNGYQGRGQIDIVTPAVSGWMVYEWNEPASKSVLQALDDLASQIGWRCRYRWHEVRQQFVLMFYDPTLLPTSLGATFSNFKPDPIVTVGKLSSKVDDIRNVWVGEYANNSTKDPQGDRQVHVVAALSASSAIAYGRRYARVAVASDSLINRNTEAQAYVDTGLADMGLPIADMEVETMFDPRAQLGDVVEMTSESNYSNQAPQVFGQTMYGSCVSISHSIGRDKARTMLGLRQVTTSTPVNIVARVARYDEMIAQVGSLPGRGASPPKTPAAPTVVNLAAINANRYIRVAWAIAAGDLNGAYLETEIHISTTSNFTPSSSTLTTFGAVVRGTTVVLHGFTVGTTYHVRLVHVDRMGNRSAVSPQTSFVS